MITIKHKSSIIYLVLIHWLPVIVTFHLPLYLPIWHSNISLSPLSPDILDKGWLLLRLPYLVLTAQYKWLSCSIGCLVRAEYYLGVQEVLAVFEHVLVGLGLLMISIDLDINVNGVLLLMVKLSVGILRLRNHRHGYGNGDGHGKGEGINVLNDLGSMRILHKIFTRSYLILLLKILEGSISKLTSDHVRRHQIVRSTHKVSRHVALYCLYIHLVWVQQRIIEVRISCQKWLLDHRNKGDIILVDEIVAREAHVGFQGPRLCILLKPPLSNERTLLRNNYWHAVLDRLPIDTLNVFLIICVLTMYNRPLFTIVTV